MPFEIKNWLTFGTFLLEGNIEILSKIDNFKEICNDFISTTEHKKTPVFFASDDSNINQTVDVNLGFSYDYICKTKFKKKIDIDRYLYNLFLKELEIPTKDPVVYYQPEYACLLKVL